MKRILFAIACGAFSLSAATYYVDNVEGNDSNDGSKDKTVASIEKGLSLQKNVIVWKLLPIMVSHTAVLIRGHTVNPTVYNTVEQLSILWSSTATALLYPDFL